MLDTVDEAIARTEAVIEKLKRIRTGLLHDLLTRGLDENSRLRDPIAHPEQFQGSPLGPTPKAWKVSTLGQQFTLERGFDITVAEQRPGDVPVISSSGITSFHDRSMVDSDGVVTGRKGKLGEAYYIDRPFWPHDTTLWVSDFHGNDKRFGAVFLTSLRLERFDAATSVPTLNRNFIHPMRVALPPREEQELIVRTLEDYDNRIRFEDDWRRKLSLLKTGLMHDVLTGGVRVPESILATEVPA